MSTDSALSTRPSVLRQWGILPLFVYVAGTTLPVLIGFFLETALISTIGFTGYYLVVLSSPMISVYATFFTQLSNRGQLIAMVLVPVWCYLVLVGATVAVISTIDCLACLAD